MERFEIAAARVRILTYDDIVAGNDKVYWQLDANIYRSLACARQGRAKLLPRLQQLTWTVLNDDVYPCILLFLSPNIRDLAIFMATGKTASGNMRFSLLTSLASQCPSVRSLALHMRENSLISWRNLFSRHASGALFTLWTGLESLALRNLDLGPLMDVLVGLPALTTLDLRSCQTADASSPSQNGKKGFCKLKHLILFDCSFDSCLHALGCMHSTPLASIDIRVVGASHQAQWVGLFSKLKNGVLQDSLSIMFISSRQRADNLRNVSLSFQTISPLLSFQRLTHFTLLGFGAHDLEPPNNPDVWHAPEARKE